jgi:hypothetical protein
MREATIVGGHVECCSSRERRPEDRIRIVEVLKDLAPVSV